MYTRLPAVAYRTTSYGTTFYLDLAQKSNVGEPPPRQPFSHVKFHLLYLLYLQQQKENTKTTHLGKPGSKIFFSQYSFLKTYLKNHKESHQEEENRSEPLISCVCLSLLGGTSSLFGIILLDASLQWSVRFYTYLVGYLPYLTDSWRLGGMVLNETKMR